MEAQLTVILLFFICGGTALKLPSYIKQCSKKDQNFDQCAMRSGTDALPYLINGDRKYDVPVLDPMFIEKMTVEQSGITMSALNVTLSGVKDGTLESVRLDFDKHTVYVEYKLPVMGFTGNYEMSGKLISLPIAGHGDFNITVYDALAKYTSFYNLTEMSDGQVYAIPVDYDIDFTMGNAYIHLGNLFNGNKALGDVMNTVLNENWRDVVKELGPSLFRALGLVIQTIFSGVMKKVPYNELFSDATYM